MFREHTLQTDATTIHYAEAPATASPLVFLHGVTRCWQNWTLLAPYFLPRWRLLALDFHGHGQSGRCPDRYRVADYIDDGRALVQQAGPATVVYGHSLGAMVALALAAESDLDIRAVILEDPPFQTMGRRIRETSWHSLFVGMRSLLDDEKPVAELASQLAELRVTSPTNGQTTRLGDIRDKTSLRFTARSLQQLDPDVFNPILAGEWLVGYDFEAYLARVACPVLLLQADQAANGMLTDEDAEQIESMSPECLRIRFPNVGHLIHWTETDRVVRLVTGFLESLDI